ncbi:MAG: hypothetical protein ACOYXM_06080 [Actinomycetota bacterium]
MSDEPHHHAPDRWRLLAATATFISVLGGISIVFDAKVFALMCLVMAVAMAFLAGYLYRQDLLDTGRVARLRYFRLRGDEDRA